MNWEREPSLAARAWRPLLRVRRDTGLWPSDALQPTVRQSVALLRLTRQGVHMAGSFFRSGRISTIALTLSLAACPITAEAQEERTSTALAKALSVGTAVTVTQWSGRKTQGHVIELSDCLLVLRAWNEPVELPIQSIKTIKRHQSKETGKTPGALSQVVRYCENASCTPGELMYMSAAVVLKAFGGAGRSTKTVYRAKRPEVAPVSCLRPPVPDSTASQGSSASSQRSFAFGSPSTDPARVAGARRGCRRETDGLCRPTERAARLTVVRVRG